MMEGMKYWYRDREVMRIRESVCVQNQQSTHILSLSRLTDDEGDDDDDGKAKSLASGSRHESRSIVTVQREVHLNDPPSCATVLE